MQFGIQLPTYWSDYGDTGAKHTLERAASLCSDLEFDSLWCNDHVITPAQGRPVGTIVEPLITLASVAHLAPNLKLGTSVLVLPQRNAIVVAKQAAALDLLTDGRLMLGIGVGWNEPEFDFLNADFSRRGRHTDEAIQIMRTLWSEGNATFHGEFYRVEDAVFEPKPQQKRIPLWIGGSSPAAIRRAARFGDAWSPFGIGVDAFRDGTALLHEETGNRPSPLLAAHLMLNIPASAGEKAEGHVNGSPARVAAVLKEYQAAGLQALICGIEAHDFEDWQRQLHIIAEKIRPQLRQ
jgi:probable F420-dependent oxidoreductase